MCSTKTITFISTLLAVLACVYTQIAPGSNAYLPPKKNGYDYPEPDKPFTQKPPGPRPPGPRQPAPPAPRTPGPKPPGPPPGQKPGGGPNPPPGAPGHVHMPGNPFDFQYAVQDQASANDYSHKASSDGDVVTGEYRVQMPDGRTQVVKYTADWATGYHAEVSYEGEAQFAQGPGGRPGYRY